MIHNQQLEQISEVCRTLGADVRYFQEYGHLVVLAWESEGEDRALFIQHQIQQEAANNPDLVCYCFDSFSTLVYAVQNVPQSISITGGIYNGTLFGEEP